MIDEDKEIMVHDYNQLLFSHKKGKSSHLQQHG
jgi:hypothetical protein